MGEYTTDVIELKKIMVERGLSKICRLSSASGINRTTLGNIISGKTQPSANVIKKLINALDISPEMAGHIFLSHTYVLSKSASFKPVATVV